MDFNKHQKKKKKKNLIVLTECITRLRKQESQTNSFDLMILNSYIHPRAMGWK